MTEAEKILDDYFRVRARGDASLPRSKQNVKDQVVLAITVAMRLGLYDAIDLLVSRRIIGR